MAIKFPLWILLTGLTRAKSGEFSREREGKSMYCVVGAGTAGLQMASFMQKAGWDYVVLERASEPGSFFKLYPRHRKLISINKRHTGREAYTPGGRDYNLRHDWHSFITEDDSLLMKHFSRKFFPSADEYLAYIHAFVNKTRPNVRYGHEVVEVKQQVDRKHQYSYNLKLKIGSDMFMRWHCANLLLATGMYKPNVPKMRGLRELAESYREFDLDPNKYANKTVAIIGSGNSGFEVAKSLMDETAYTHVWGKQKKMAWETHYPGDLRSINAVPFDNYQLKSQDIFYLDLFDRTPRVQKRMVEGEKKICIDQDDAEEMESLAETPKGLDKDKPDHSLNFRDRVKSRVFFCYDYVIYCTGFVFDHSLLKGLPKRHPTVYGRDGTKYPKLRSNYESVMYRNMFFLGANAHSLDYKRSSGGFIHGFRYTTRYLFNLLNEYHHYVEWPHTRLTLGPDMLSNITLRMDTSSALYQMFGILCDVLVIRSRAGAGEVIQYHEIPLAQAYAYALGESGEKKGDLEYLTVSLEYGPEFHGEERVWGRRVFHDWDPAKAHLSQFLHPVIRYWNPGAKPAYYSSQQSEGVRKPRATAEHHVLESLDIDFKDDVLHTKPLNNFLDRIRHGPLMAADPEVDLSWPVKKPECES